MSSNPFMARHEKKGVTSHGRVSERRVAKSIAARLTPGSGNMRGAKGDSRMEAKKDFLVESKSTTACSMILDFGWLVKIYTEALNIGRVPALTVSFVMPDGKVRVKGDWVLIPLQDFKELTEED